VSLYLEVLLEILNYWICTACFFWVYTGHSAIALETLPSKAIKGWMDALRSELTPIFGADWALNLELEANTGVKLTLTDESWLSLAVREVSANK
jgi:hypothetical protein